MAWELYKEIKYTADGVPSGTLSGFPKLVSVSGDADIASECSAGGGIKFTTPDGLTDLSFGLYPSVDLSSGDVLARVKLDLSHMASVGDVMCRLYYSATETTIEDKAGTVDNDYAVFCPLEEDPSGAAPQIFDWVAESFIGTAQGGMTSGDLVAGAVGSGLNFDGSDDVLSLGNIGAATGKIVTYEAVIQTVQMGPNHYIVLESGPSNRFSGIIYDGGVVRFQLSAGGTVNTIGTTNVADGNLHSVAGVLGSTVSRVFVDGAEDATGDISGLADPALNLLRVGLSCLAMIDEVRVSTVARSADWLAYAHIDDLDNSSTFTLGEEQGGGGGPTFNPAWAVGSNIVIMGM